jgi:death-on-curing protein
MHYPECGDFCDVAASVLGIAPEQVARLPNVGLAESALAAPRAGFGDLERYPTLLEKAAVLLEWLARNHPLPDGNKRTAFIVMGLFLEANGRRFTNADADVDVPLVERVAAGDAGHAEIINWLETRTAPDGHTV